MVSLQCGFFGALRVDIRANFSHSLTFKQFLSCVNPLMLKKMIRLPEGFFPAITVLGIPPWILWFILMFDFWLKGFHIHYIERMSLLCEFYDDLWGWFLDKCFPTPTTSIWFRSCVDSLMSLRADFWTNVFSHSLHLFGLSTVVWLLGESLSTFITCKWFPASVSSVILHEMSFLTEGFSTSVAFVWIYLTMNPLAYLV